MALSSRSLLSLARGAALGWYAAAPPEWRGRAGALAASLWLYPTLARNCRWHGPVVRRFRTEAREVWLTLDDGPDARCSPAMLDLLDAHGAKATFFAIGRLVDAHRKVAREIVRRGHGLENHTYSHITGAWWAGPAPFVQSEIEACSHSIRVATGTHPRFFRNPVGMCGPWVHPAAAQAGLRVVGWSASGCDGCVSIPSDAVGRIMKRIKPGAIVLLHVGKSVRHRLMALQRLLCELEDHGYRCVIPADEALIE